MAATIKSWSGVSAAGVEVQTSCEQDVCGPCITRVLARRARAQDRYSQHLEEQAAKRPGNNVLFAATKSARLALRSVVATKPLIQPMEWARSSLDASS